MRPTQRIDRHHGGWIGRAAALCVAAVGVLFSGGLLPADAQRAAAIQPAGGAADVEAELREALGARGWGKLPGAVGRVSYGGPTPAVRPGAPPGPAWYTAGDAWGNFRRDAVERLEAAFVRSVEAAHAGRTRLIEAGSVLLVDPGGRVWAVATHAPHLLRCYDGKGWAYRRADGLPAADDEPAAFARLLASGKLPRPEYAKGGLRQLNDLGRWYPAACADAAGKPALRRRLRLAGRRGPPGRRRRRPHPPARRHLGLLPHLPGGHAPQLDAPAGEPAVRPARGPRRRQTGR